MIKFIEHQVGGYKERTIENSKCDLTLAFAVDFTTYGEILTKKSAKKYIPISLNNLDTGMVRLTKIALACGVGNKTINIAGNGIYSLPESQEFYDNFINEFLTNLFYACGCEWEYIVSGGQTGIDESGLKFGDKFGLQTICRAPKNWLFRYENKKDISDEYLFKQRFIQR